MNAKQSHKGDKQEDKVGRMTKYGRMKCDFIYYVCFAVVCMSVSVTRLLHLVEVVTVFVDCW